MPDDPPSPTAQTGPSPRWRPSGPATILIAVHPDLPLRAPEIIEMLRAWDLNIDRYNDVGKWRRANTDASINDTALWWLNNTESLWTGWVTAEAAESIKSSLESNRIPDGWPTE